MKEQKMTQKREMLEIIERLVNERASKLAAQMSLKLGPADFKIQFVPDAAHETILTPGTCVLIRTRIPFNHPEFNSFLRGWLKAASRLHADSELDKKEGNYTIKNRKLAKTRDNEDILFPSLLPSRRIRTRIFTRVTMRDTKTGLEVEKEDETTSYYGLMEAARIELSRNVREIEPEEPDIEIRPISSVEKEIIKEIKDLEDKIFEEMKEEMDEELNEELNDE